MTKIGPKGPSQGAPWTEREMDSGRNAVNRTEVVLSKVNREVGKYVAAGVPWTRGVKRLREDPLRGVTKGLHENSRGLSKLGIVPPAKRQRH
jgi:hypothetical protein